jgi:uncharacterized membrane protein
VRLIRFFFFTGFFFTTFFFTGAFFVALGVAFGFAVAFAVAAGFAVAFAVAVGLAEVVAAVRVGAVESVKRSERASRSENLPLRVGRGRINRDPT